MRWLSRMRSRQCCGLKGWVVPSALNWMKAGSTRSRSLVSYWSDWKIRHLPITALFFAIISQKPRQAYEIVGGHCERELKADPFDAADFVLPRPAIIFVQPNASSMRFLTRCEAA